MSEQVITKEMVQEGLRNLALRIANSKLSYNPRRDEIMWYSLAQRFYPELLYIIDAVSDRMAPGGGETFYKRKV